MTAQQNFKLQIWKQHKLVREQNGAPCRSNPMRHVSLSTEISFRCALQCINLIVEKLIRSSTYLPAAGWLLPIRRLFDFFECCWFCRGPYLHRNYLCGKWKRKHCGRSQTQKGGNQASAAPAYNQPLVCTLPSKLNAILQHNLKEHKYTMSLPCSC